MTPKQLLFAHRYSEAAETYRLQMVRQPEKNYNDGLGRALLCLKRFSEAIPVFEKANEMASRRLKGNFPCLNEIGAAMWLAEKRVDAIAQWRGAVDAVLDETCLYGDAAGGATQGLLLWYGAVTQKNSMEREYALKYLEGVRRKNAYGVEIWPLPPVSMVLGAQPFEKTLTDGIGASDLEICIKMARTDLLKRRHLCQALFYGACREREAGNETACMDKMQACFHLENPIIEIEWYLARGECSQKRT